MYSSFHAQSLDVYLEVVNKWINNNLGCLLYEVEVSTVKVWIPSENSNILDLCWTGAIIESNGRRWLGVSFTIRLFNSQPISHLPFQSQPNFTDFPFYRVHQQSEWSTYVINRLIILLLESPCSFVVGPSRFFTPSNHRSKKRVTAVNGNHKKIVWRRTQKVWSLHCLHCPVELT